MVSCSCSRMHRFDSKTSRRAGPGFDEDSGWGGGRWGFTSVPILLRYVMLLITTAFQCNRGNELKLSGGISGNFLWLSRKAARPRRSTEGRAFAKRGGTQRLHFQNMPQRGWILLGEDDSDDVLFIKRAFESADVEHELLVARDGQEVLDCLNRDGRFGDRPDGEPSVIVLDHHMPVLDGLTVLRRLKEHPI